MTTPDSLPVRQSDGEKTLADRSGETGGNKSGGGTGTPGSLVFPSEEMWEVEAAGEAAPEAPGRRRRSAACLRGVGRRSDPVRPVQSASVLMRRVSEEHQSGGADNVLRGPPGPAPPAPPPSEENGFSRWSKLRLETRAGGAASPHASAANFPIWLQPHLNFAPWKKGLNKLA